MLTYGNFYETEKDHEFCCETCPDEEKTTKVDESNRLSISQKIALFERESSSVLKKSLSDEEKSKSLSRQSPAKSEALNNFLTTQITTEAQPTTDEDEKTIDTLSSDSESEDEDSTVPPIPSNHPSNDVIPSISDNEITFSDHNIISETPDNSVVTKELTHGKDVEAIAKIAETQSESHGVRTDINIAHLAVVESNTKEPEASPDDIDLLFEQLVEDAVKTPIVSIPIISKQSPSQIKQLSAEETVKEEPKPSVDAPIPEPELILPPTVPEIIVQPEALEETVLNEEPLLSEIAPVKDTSAEDLKPGDSEYPADLDPFGDDEEKVSSPNLDQIKRENLNPFGSCSEDEDEQENNHRPATTNFGTLPKPPRPPLPKAMTLKTVSTNPFGSDDEDEPQKLSSATRTPVPTPRKPML